VETSKRYYREGGMLLYISPNRREHE